MRDVLLITSLSRIKIKDQSVLGIELGSKDYLQKFCQVIEQLDNDSLVRWSDHLYRVWDTGQRCFIIGNGGSGTTASHMAEDLGKSTIPEQDLVAGNQKRLKVMSLTDNAGWIMAVGNDLSYEEIFVQQLMNFAEPNDLLLAISGSGNSPNILRAVNWANENGLTTYGITGFGGGQLKQIQADGFHVDLNDMGMVESVHLAAFHWVLNDVYARINHEGRHQNAS